MAAKQSRTVRRGPWETETEYLQTAETRQLTEPLHWHDGTILSDPDYVPPSVFDQEASRIEFWCKHSERWPPKPVKKRKPRKKKPAAKPPAAAPTKSHLRPVIPWPFPPPNASPFYVRVSVTSPPHQTPAKTEEEKDIDGLTLKGLSLANARQVTARLKYYAAAVAVIISQPGKMRDPDGGGVIEVFTCGTVSEARSYIKNVVKLNNPVRPFDVLIFDRERYGAFKCE